MPGMSLYKWYNTFFNNTGMMMSWHKIGEDITQWNRHLYRQNVIIKYICKSWKLMNICMRISAYYIQFSLWSYTRSLCCFAWELEKDRLSRYVFINTLKTKRIGLEHAAHEQSAPPNMIWRRRRIDPFSPRPGGRNENLKCVPRYNEDGLHPDVPGAVQFIIRQLLLHIFLCAPLPFWNNGRTHLH